MISEIELLQKWLTSHNEREISVSANSRYETLRQVRKGFIDKYGKDIYCEVVTGKKAKIVKSKKIRYLSYDPISEPQIIEISSGEQENVEPLNNIKPDISDQEVSRWNRITSSILGTYWDYVYVKELVIGLYG